MKLRVCNLRFSIGNDFVLIRVTDGRIEAGGFETAAEARKWAEEQGHTIDD